VEALADESAEERAERIALVQAAQQLVLLAFQRAGELVDA
jgi:hypothetical protein